MAYCHVAICISNYMIIIWFITNDDMPHVPIFITLENNLKYMTIHLIIFQQMVVYHMSKLFKI